MNENKQKRAQRIAGQIRQELADLLINHVKDPRVGFATLTEVRVTGDLRKARVFVSTIGTDEEREATKEALQRASGFLRRELAQRMRLKFTPQLEFFNDTSLDRADRVEAVFGAIHGGAMDAPPDSPFEPPETKNDRSSMANRADEFREKDLKREHKAAATPTSRKSRHNKRRR
ncbi:30S ribosome-binding factor RbfA [Myxococcota bacterium]|nr:30S ribosome-binding factor RbfA [Myxococcota bacterium]